MPMFSLNIDTVEVELSIASDSLLYSSADALTSDITPGKAFLPATVAIKAAF